MAAKETKRFIAGAVCPQCGLMDKICWFIGQDDERISCVSCGYTELKSEVQPAHSETKKTSEQPVQWFPAKRTKNTKQDSQ